MNLDAQKEFGTRECASCGMEVAENNNRCPICKYEFPNRTPGAQGYRTLIGILLLLFFTALAFGLLR